MSRTMMGLAAVMMPSHVPTGTSTAADQDVNDHYWESFPDNGTTDHGAPEDGALALRGCAVQD
jgi:hypothetical protein